jgi:hypothetical protein
MGTTETRFVLPDGPEIPAAVAWWAQRLGSPIKDNGDGLPSILAMATLPFSNDAGKIEGFAAALTDALRAKVAAIDLDWLILDCDYGPDETLGNAARDAGLPSSQFPWKTTMWIRPGEVKVRNGYGRETQTIYPAAVPR